MPFAEKKIIGEVWARNKQKWEKQSKNQFGTESETNNQAKHHKKVVSRLREVFINFKDETQNSSTFKATYKKVRCIVKQYEQDLFGKERNDLK